jgi:serine/threonine protein kinase
LGPFPPQVLRLGKDTGKYFTIENMVYEREDDGAFQLILPKKTNLRSRLHVPLRSTKTDDLFVDFVNKMLNLDPVERISAVEALQHPWLQDADTVDIGEYIIRQPTDFPPPPPPYDDDDEEEEEEEDEDEGDVAEEDEAEEESLRSASVLSEEK